jgi:hypothetical protein
VKTDNQKVNKNQEMKVKTKENKEGINLLMKI